MTRDFRSAYASVLKAFVHSREERHLSEAAELGGELMRADVPPEEIAEIHEAAIRCLAEESPDETRLEFAQRVSAPLMELLMAYALACRARHDERDLAEESLRRTQFALDHAADAIYWVRKDGRIFYANEAASRSLGYSRDELSTMSVPEIDPDFPPEAWGEHWRELKEAGSITFEAHHRARNGRVFPVEVTTSFVEHGSEEFMWGYVRDISERREVEAERRRVAEELARKNAEFKHFNELAVGRELRMIELKRRINELLDEAGMPPAYDTSFAPDVVDSSYGQ